MNENAVEVLNTEVARLETRIMRQKEYNIDTKDHLIAGEAAIELMILRRDDLLMSVAKLSEETAN